MRVCSTTSRSSTRFRVGAPGHRIKESRTLCSLSHPAEERCLRRTSPGNVFPDSVSAVLFLLTIIEVGIKSPLSLGDPTGC